MGRGIAGVVAAVVVWFVVATLGNLVLRAAWTGYSEVEAAMHFTLAMLVARLLLGAVSSLCAGFAVAWITKGSRRSAYILAALLLVMFIPVHYSLWDRFPVWYHLVFLASLVVATLAGAMVHPGASADRTQTRVDGPTS
jgi:hypothetical protein